MIYLDINKLLSGSNVPENRLISMFRRMRLLEKVKLLKRTKLYCLRLILCAVINTEIYYVVKNSTLKRKCSNVSGIFEKANYATTFTVRHILDLFVCNT